MIMEEKMRKHVTIRKGNLRNASIKADFKVSNYIGDDNAKKRVILFGNPDMILTIRDCTGDASLSTPDSYDYGYRVNLEDDCDNIRGDCDDIRLGEGRISFKSRRWCSGSLNRVRQEGKLYRRVMSFYPNISMLTERELEKMINDCQIEEV